MKGSLLIIFTFFWYSIVWSSIVPPNDAPCPLSINPPIENTFGSPLVFSGNNCCAIGANDDPNADFQNQACSAVLDDDAVWFIYQPTFTADGISIEISIPASDALTDGAIEVYSGQPEAGCTGELALVRYFCGSFPIEISAPYCSTLNDVFWIKLTSRSDQCGEYTITIDDQSACVSFAERCEQLTISLIDDTDADFSPTCIEGCLELACPEIGEAEAFCDFGNIPTVWYQIDTDFEASVLFIEVNPYGNWEPVWAMFEEGIDCQILQPLTIDGPLSPCSSISGGNAFAQVAVHANRRYWLALGAKNGDFNDPNESFDFELCVTSSENIISCLPQDVTDFTLDGTPVGGHQWDPSAVDNLLCPGETYELCCNFFYDASQTGADWLIGIVPSLGSGWEPIDPYTANINTTPSANASYYWYETGGPLQPVLQESVPNICTFTNPQTGLLEICNALSDGSCSLCINGIGMSPGEPLPSGWFWVSNGGNAGCENDGSPGEGWGVGWTVGSVSLCIPLTVKEFADQSDCLENKDLSFSFMPFSDGIAGCWNDPLGECNMDYKQRITFHSSCQESSQVVHVNPGVGDTICSGGVLNVEVALDDMSLKDIGWTAIDNPNVSGETIVSITNPPINVFVGGQGILRDTLVNLGYQCEKITYHLFAYDPQGLCGSNSLEIDVWVQPSFQALTVHHQLCKSDSNFIDLGLDTTLCAFDLEWLDQMGNSLGNNAILPLPSDIDTGQHVFSLLGSSSLGCTVDLTVELEVQPMFDFDFDQDTIDICQDLLMPFHNFEIDTTTITGTPPYDFDNVNWFTTSPLSVLRDTSKPNGYILDYFSVPFITPPYTIFGELNDANGCSFVQEIVLKLNRPPSAVLTQIGASPCSNDSLPVWTLRSFGTDMFSQFILHDIYNHNDSLIHSVTAESYNFDVSDSGTYTLVTTDNEGCTSRAQLSIELDSITDVLIEGDMHICEGDSLQLSFTNTADFVDPTVLWSNGNTTFELFDTPIVSTTYELSVFNSNGCSASASHQVEVISNPEAAFSYLDITGGIQFTYEGMGATDFEWDFGDGETSTEENPTHTYASSDNFTVTLRVSNICGEDVLVEEIFYSNLPRADFYSVFDSHCLPTNITYYNSSIASSSLFWTFENGTPSTSTEENPIIFYNEEGQFDVKLVATNANGTDSIFKENYIDFLFPPIADFEVMQSATEISLINNSVATDATYYWEFGDGNTSTEFEPSHTYASLGNYQVRLTVTNACGPDILLKDIVLSLTLPNIDISYSSTEGCLPLTIQIMDNSAGDPDTWEWSFPGGVPSTSSAQHPEVTYHEKGIFTINAVISNGDGSSYYTLKSGIEVRDVPLVDFDYTQNGEEVLFDNLSIEASSVLWDFGDGNTSDEFHPIHSYENDGVYTITLSATNSCGTTTKESQIMVVTSGTTHVEEANNIKVYPNPSRGKIVIQAAKKGLDGKVAVYNLLGKMVYEQNLLRGVEKTALDLSNLHGAHIMILHLDDEQHVIKLIVI